MHIYPMLQQIALHMYAVRRPWALMTVFVTLSLCSSSTALTWLFGLVAGVFLLDTYARLVISEKLYHHLRRTDGDPGAFDKRLSSSWCGRGVMTAHLPHYEDIYEIRGYRWFHILPDDGLRSYTRLNFWKKAFGLDAFEVNHRGETKG